MSCRVKKIYKQFDSNRKIYEDKLADKQEIEYLKDIENKINKHNSK